MSNTTNPPPIPEGIMTVIGELTAKYLTKEFPPLMNSGTIPRSMEWIRCHEVAQETAIALYRHLSPTGESAGRWVHVQDRKPPESEKTICFKDSSGNNQAAKFERGSFWWRNSYTWVPAGPVVCWLDESPSQPSAGMGWPPDIIFAAKWNATDLMFWVLQKAEMGFSPGPMGSKEFYLKRGEELTLVVEGDWILKDTKGEFHHIPPTPTKTEGQ